MDQISDNIRELLRTCLAVVMGCCCFRGCSYLPRVMSKQEEVSCVLCCAQALPAQSLLLNIQEFCDPTTLGSLKFNDGSVHNTKFCKCYK